MSLVRTKREELGISMTELAKRTGFSLVKLSRIENDRRKLKVDDVAILAYALKCKTGDLIPDREESTPEEEPARVV